VQNTVGDRPTYLSKNDPVKIDSATRARMQDVTISEIETAVHGPSGEQCGHSKPRIGKSNDKAGARLT